MPGELAPVVAGLVVGIAFVVIVSLAFGAGFILPNTSPENVTITMDRTACFGACPDYSLVIYGNGTVHYDGHRYVSVTGKQTATIPQEDVNRLVRKSIEIGYFGLRDSYTEPVTDLPTTTTSVTIDGLTKKIVDYAGAPSSLKDFERMIDEISGSARWVKCPDAQPIRNSDGGCV